MHMVALCFALFAISSYCWHITNHTLSSIYLTNGIQNHTSLITTDKYFTYILAQRFQGSSDYLFLRRNNSYASTFDSTSLLEHNTNYWIESPFVISGYTVKGFTVKDQLLKYIVATEDSSSELHIIQYQKTTNLY